VPAPPPHTPLFVACDFDGTITMRDTLALVVGRWAPGVWDTIEGRLRDGEVTLLEAMDEEFRHVCATEAQVIDYVVAQTRIRPGFAEFVQWLADRGDRLIVVSAGFRVLIDPVLQAAGLGDLHVHAGDALFSPAGTVLSYPPSSHECVSGCGHCKSETIAAHGPFAGPVVYVGDGYSDRCAAMEADIVFARPGLAAYLDTQGVAYHPFEDFFEVRRVLEAS
jgi:2-hydroxy-3-keto-5-methylthiopentenyl-1-phosphate phosphatase